MFSGTESISFFDCECFPRQVKAEKLFDHRECFCVSDNLYVGIVKKEFSDKRTVIRFHVIDNDIVKIAAVQYRHNVFYKLFSDRIVGCIKKNCLFIQKKV